jgi:hypothetical protein
MSPADAAALAETVVAYDACRIRQVLPVEDEDRRRAADASLSSFAA